MTFGFRPEVARRKIRSKLREAPVFGGKKKKKGKDKPFKLKGFSAPKERFVNIDGFRR